MTPADLDAEWFRSWCAQAGWEPTPADVEAFVERVAIQLEGDDFPELVDHVRLRVAREWERTGPGGVWGEPWSKS